MFISRYELKQMRNCLDKVAILNGNVQFLLGKAKAESEIVELQKKVADLEAEVQSLRDERNAFLDSIHRTSKELDRLYSLSPDELKESFESGINLAHERFQDQQVSVQLPRQKN